MNKLIELATVLRFGYILDHHIILLVIRLIDAGFAQKIQNLENMCLHICLIAGECQIEQH